MILHHDSQLRSLVHETNFQQRLPLYNHLQRICFSGSRLLVRCRKKLTSLQSGAMLRHSSRIRTTSKKAEEMKNTQALLATLCRAKKCTPGSRGSLARDNANRTNRQAYKAKNKMYNNQRNATSDPDSDAQPLPTPIPSFPGDIPQEPPLEPIHFYCSITPCLACLRGECDGPACEDCKRGCVTTRPCLKTPHQIHPL